MIAERIREKVIDTFVLPLKKVLLPPKSDIPYISPEQTALELSIKENARKIADNVRKYGEQRYGEIWAQGYSLMHDGRVAFLQHGLGDTHINATLKIIRIYEALEIMIPGSYSSQNRVHIRYDLTSNAINTYEERQEDNTPVIAYWIHDQPIHGTRIPVNLKLADIVKPVDDILQSVVLTSNIIGRKESDFYSLIYSLHTRNIYLKDINDF